MLRSREVAAFTHNKTPATGFSKTERTGADTSGR